MSRPRQTKRISVRLTADLERRLRRRARITGQPESEIVRQAIGSHLADAPKPESAEALARRLGLVDCAPGLPPDLSTNKKYFEGFGRDR